MRFEHGMSEHDRIHEQRQPSHHPPTFNKRSSLFEQADYMPLGSQMQLEFIDVLGFPSHAFIDGQIQTRASHIIARDLDSVSIQILSSY